MGNKKETILVIPDLHIPYEHPDAFKFVDQLNERYRPKQTICLGDELDFHAISFHDSDPELLSASKELEDGIFILKDLYAIFPRVTVLESNHGSLVFRKIKHHGLPARVIRPLREILEAPKGWNWVFDLTITLQNGQRVYFHHGKSGRPTALAKQMGMCAVQGHFHEKFQITHWRNSEHWFWDAHVGCLIDPESFAFAYARNNVGYPCLGAMVIENCVPKLIPMLLNKKGRWIGKLPF